MLLVDTPNAGMPEIQRAAFFVLFDTLNDALVLVEQSWATSDQSFSDRTGRPFVPTTLEPVEDDNFHEGLDPSLIQAPIEKFPNCSVLAYRATPGPGAALLDHQEVYRVSLTIEAMVKATPEEGVDICNRRCNRMVQAVHTCLMANQTLGGIVSGFDGTPTINVTEMFTRKDRGGDASSRGTRTSYGPEWLWQGARLEYAVRKEASMPSHGSNFRSAPTYEGLSVDQI